MPASLMFSAALGFIGLCTMAAGLRMGIGTAAMPAGGAWPIVVGLALTAAGFAIALERRAPHRAEPAPRGQVRVVGAVLAMAVLYRPAGLLVAAMVAAGLASGAFPGAGRRWAMPVAGLAAFGLWLMLDLGVELPIRLWPQWMHR